MAVVATAELEGSSNVSGAWSTDLSAARDRLDAFGKTASESTNKVAQGSDAAGKAVQVFTGALGGIGVAVSASKLIEVATELDQVGAAALRASNNLDVLTGGQGAQWMDQMQASANGLIDDEDAAGVATKLLATHLANTSTEASHLIRDATVLGAVFKDGMGAKEASIELANMLNTMSSRGLKDFGINIEQLKNRQDALLLSNKALSEQQAFSMAFYEQADPLVAKLSGNLNDEAAHIEQLKIAWADATEEIGKYIAKAADPAIQQATRTLEGKQAADAFSASLADVKANLAATTPDFRDYVEQLRMMGVNTEIGREGMSKLGAEFKQLRAVAVANQMEITSAARESDAVTQTYTATLGDLKKAYGELQGAVSNYTQILAQQSALQLNTEQQVKDLTGLWWSAGSATKGTKDQIADLTDSLSKANETLTKQNLSWGDSAKHSSLATYNLEQAQGAVDDLTQKLADANTQVEHGAGANWAEIFQFASGQMQQMGLSSDQLLAKYNELGLKTGQVTELEIAQGTALRELDNLYANGKISVDTYLSGLSQIPAAADAAAAASIAVKSAVQEATQAAVEQGKSAASIIQTAIDTSLSAKAVADGGLAEAQGKASEAAQQMEDVFNNLSPEFKVNVDTTMVDNAIQNIDLGIKALSQTTTIDANGAQADATIAGLDKHIKSLAQTITIMVNYEEGGTVPPGHAFGGPAPVGGGLTVVGEHGPELLYMPPGSFVATAPETSALMSGMSGGSAGPMPGGGGPMTINLYAYGVNDPGQLVDMVARELRAQGLQFGTVK